MYAQVKLNPNLFYDDWGGGFERNYYKIASLKMACMYM